MMRYRRVGLRRCIGVSVSARLRPRRAIPTKPVKIIVPFTAGSATDILARTVGQKLSEMWGQPVVVENRAGRRRHDRRRRRRQVAAGRTTP